MPDLLLDQGSKKSSSLSFVLDPPLGKDDCNKIRMMMYIIILCLTIIWHFYITHWLLGIWQCQIHNFGKTAVLKKKLWIVNQSFSPAWRNHCSQGTLLRILVKKFECSTCARTWLFEIFYTFVCKNFSCCWLKLGKVADQIIYRKSKASDWRNLTTGIEPKIWVALVYNLFFFRTGVLRKLSTLGFHKIYANLMSFNDKTLLFLMWLPTWQDGFQNHNNNHNILHLQMYMYLFFCGHWSRSSHCSCFIWWSLLSCKHGKWVKAIKSISFSLNQTQWICSKWCFGCAGRCSIQLLKRAFNTLQKKEKYLN